MGHQAGKSAVIPVHLRRGGTVVFVVHSGCTFVASRRVHARRGANKLRFAPRRLAPGTYRVRVDLLRGGERMHLRTVGVAVTRQHGRLTSRLRPAPAAPVCSGSVPPAMLAAGSPLASVKPKPPSQAVAAGPSRHRRGGVLGAHFSLPKLGSALPGGSGGAAGFVLAMYLLAALAVGTLLVGGARRLDRQLRDRKP